MTRPDTSSSTRLAARLVCGLAMLVAASVALLATSCVETAECNESVTCPDDEVCYEFRCRAICESDQECADGYECLPCKPPELADTNGHCFGAEASACVAQQEEQAQ